MKFTASVLALLLSPAVSFVPVAVNRGKREIVLQATVEAPVRKPEAPERVEEVRERFRQASVDADQAKGCVKEETGNEWWRTPEDELSRKVCWTCVRVYVCLLDNWFSGSESSARLGIRFLTCMVSWR